MIKNIIVKNLLVKGRNLEWDINGRKFLYGQNGIGKTTLLDSIYYALTNNKKIFSYEDDEGHIEYRKLPYEKLEITFKDDQALKKIELIGNFSRETITIKLKKLLEILEDNKPSTYKEEIKNLINKFELLIIMENAKIEKKDKVKLFAHAIEKYGKNQDFIRSIGFHNIPTEEVNSLYSQIMNEENSSSRKMFRNEYNVLYLPVERLAPDLASRYSKRDRIFKRQFKYNLVETIQEIMEKLKDKISNFIIGITNISREFVKETLIEESSSDNDESTSELLSLKKDKVHIFEIMCSYLGIDKNDISIENVEIQKPVTRKIINKINLVDDEIKNDIHNMFNFINEVNEFFKTNNKKIMWDDMAKIPNIDDKNNQGHNILDYPYSSGERQIINILFNINFLSRKKLLILVDEIELSLAPDWQEMLYEKIKSKDNVEIIGVTHSPFVVSEVDIKEVLGAFENEPN